MRARAAQVQAVDRRSVRPVAADRTQEQQLIRRHVAVHVMTAGECEPSFEIERREHLAMQDRPRQVRERHADAIDHAVGDRILAFVPRAVRERVGLGPHTDRHDVRPLRRQARVGHARHAQLHVRLGRRLAGRGPRLVVVQVVQGLRELDQRPVIRLRRNA